MDNDNYNNIFENLGKFVIKVSEGMVKIVEGINLMASSEAMKAFIEFIINIPDDIKDTQFFAEVQKLQKINLHYEDVIWLIDDFVLNYTDEIWRKLSEDENDKSELCRYIAKIIVASSMEKREKLIVLLAHMEALIYETLEMSKIPNERLKPAVKKVSIKENVGMSAENLGKVFVLAVMYIVFANTDSYTEEIDKRIPFRNNILHNGFITYADEDIDVAYELLVNLIEMLIRTKEQMHEY